VHRRLRAGSPDRCASTASRKPYPTWLQMLSPVAADALPDPRRLLAGSPGKAFTPRPGECAGIDVSARPLPGLRCA
ncbi:hypothetical protein ORL88_08790, partial [Klebsiella oxytoca]|uniref:hypothetical protein n=1 Tax=Klebsiella oxytoca TaxID=571 RepID=UPI0022454E1B